MYGSSSQQGNQNASMQKKNNVTSIFVHLCKLFISSENSNELAP
jgi:hypothetical protein